MKSVLRLSFFSAAFALWISAQAAGVRINQEGRILGPAPAVTNATLFNTAAADGLLSAMQIFPVTSAWNEDVSKRPLLPNSDAMMAQISSDLSSSRQTLRGFFEMNFVLIPDSQPPVPITFVQYADESDPSPYPIPSNMPIETWPIGTGALTLSQWQQNVSNDTGDRHSIIVQPGNGFIWETWQAQLVGSTWQASNGAKFDLKSNAMRPAGWTSGDAAGLPMFPALVRYDECARGMVEHALRLVVKRTREEYLYPANHYASSTAASQTNVPAMGQRLRLKSSFVIPSSWTQQEKAVLLAFKKYGAIVADNGGFFSVSVTPDDRWPASAFDHLSTIGLTNFEVVQSMGATEGPRSPGAPVASAGGDQAIVLGTLASLSGTVTYTGAEPNIQWKQYAGPGTVAFGSPGQAHTTASFSAPGVYTLLLSADDGVHAVAYDAATFTVSQTISLIVSHGTGQLRLDWTGQSTSYVVERAAALSPVTPWVPALTTGVQNATFPISNASGFFRVWGQ